MMAGGLAMWSGAKLDELTSKENMLNPSEKGRNSEKEERDYILRKARENVGSPLLNEGRQPGKQLGVNYSKGHLKPNMRRAEDSFERLDKKRKSGVGMGAKAGLLTATFIQGMTDNLADPSVLKALGKGIGDIVDKGKDIHGTYPYNVMTKQGIEGANLLLEGWRGLWGQMSEVKLSSESGSMSEGTRVNAYNNLNNTFSGEKSKKTESFDNPFTTISLYTNDYVKELEYLNRNNINRLTEPYINFGHTEEMIRASMEEYNRKRNRR